MNVFLKIGKYTSTISLVFIFLMMQSVQTYANCVYAIPMAAEEVDMGNLLSWSTAEETNTDFFVVFKSTDGVDFKQVGEEKAMGISKVKKDYRFLDPATGDSKAFYRLLQVDLDGQQEYTHIAVVQKKQPNNFVVTMMGNTTTSRYFNVVFKSEEDGHMNYRLVNQQEEVVKRGVIKIDKGQNLFTLDLEKAKAGRYNFKFIMKEEEEVLVLVKASDDILVNTK